MILRLVLTIALLVASVSLASGQARLCDDAAARASREVGVPLDLLLSLTRVETGRGHGGRIEPWPWTLNMGGPGSWHDSLGAARAAASAAVAGGRRNIDLGCFQINYHWHGAQFTDLGQMLDPQANARYAAEFLRDLYAELGDWTAAAGAFHSRNQTHAARYLERYQAIRTAMAQTPQAVAPSDDTGAGPSSLSMAPRPSLLSHGAAFGLDAARPIAAVSARPLWGWD